MLTSTSVSGTVPGFVTSTATSRPAGVTPSGVGSPGVATTATSARSVATVAVAGSERTVDVVPVTAAVAVAVSVSEPASTSAAVTVVGASVRQVVVAPTARTVASHVTVPPLGSSTATADSGTCPVFCASKVQVTRSPVSTSRSPSTSVTSARLVSVIPGGQCGVRHGAGDRVTDADRDVGAGADAGPARQVRRGGPVPGAGPRGVAVAGGVGTARGLLGERQRVAVRGDQDRDVPGRGGRASRGVGTRDRPTGGVGHADRERVTAEATDDLLGDRDAGDEDTEGHALPTAAAHHGLAEGRGLAGRDDRGAGRGCCPCPCT